MTKKGKGKRPMAREIEESDEDLCLFCSSFYEKPRGEKCVFERHEIPNWVRCDLANFKRLINNDKGD